MFLFDGEVKCEGRTYNQENGVVPRERTVQAVRDCVVMRFGQVSGGGAVGEKLRVSSYVGEKEGV